MENELFSLSLNTEGAEALIKFNRRARAVFIASLVLTIINFISVVSRISSIFGVFRYTSRLLSVQVVATMGYPVFTLLIIPVQWYYYLAFSGTMQAGIAEQDSIKFNRSFRVLNSHAALSLLVIVMNILYFAYVYYSSWMLKGRI